MKTYSEMLQFKTFEDRFNYLKLNGRVGSATFGFDRYLNQALYSSSEWKKIRREIIVRDNGCDLAIQDRDIGSRIYIHHINPITEDMIVNRDPLILSFDNLVCVSFNTHQAIHYGDKDLLLKDYHPRIQGDTKLW